MKAKTWGILVVMLLALSLCGVAPAQGATSDITITIETPAEPTLGFDLSPSTWNPGVSPIDLDTVYISTVFTLENTGDVAFESDIKGTDAVGTGTWTLSNDFTNGTMIYGLAWRESPFGDDTAISKTDSDLVNLDPAFMFLFNLKMNTPTSITNWLDTLTSAVTITMVAQ